MLSHHALHTIKNSRAFSIPQAKRRKLNQHSSDYIFNDGSRLRINATRSEGIAYDSAGARIASHKLLINKQGV